MHITQKYLTETQRLWLLFIFYASSSGKTVEFVTP